MTQKAIIDTATRVIKRLTTDDVPPFDLNTETVIPLTTPIDLSGGFKKLGVDNKTLSTPTQAAIDDSGVDENRNAIIAKQKLNTISASIDAVIADPKVPQSLIDYFQALKDL